MEKKTIISGLTKLIVILLIVLICAISFLGIYKKNLNKWENMLPDYTFSKELGEARTFGFEVSTATKEVDLPKEEASEESTPDATTTPTSSTETTETDGAVITPENEGENLTAPEEESSAEPTTTQVPVNNQEDLNAKNYNKVKSIIDKRLKDFGINDEVVTVDTTTGKLSIIVPQSRMTDYSVALITTQGKVEIIDYDTKEVLISNDKISKATAGYNRSSSSTTTSANSESYDLGINLEFNGEGKKKLDEISKTYIETINEQGENSKNYFSSNRW